MRFRARQSFGKGSSKFQGFVDRRTVRAALAFGVFVGLLVAAVTSPIAFAHARTTDAHTRRTGTLKICKVAGFGVSVGTPVAFNVTTQSGPDTVTVPAGPAPSGYCAVVGTVDVGTYTVTEVRPTGDTVSSISAVPSGGTAHLGAGTFRGRVRAGIVTEVTYTNQDIPSGEETGYLEICKQLPSSSEEPPSVFVFTVDGQTVDVPPGACSAPVEVLAGSETVAETPISPWVMTTCSTVPVANLVSCDPSDNTATVTVGPGTVSGETILTVTNVATTGNDENLWFTNLDGNSIGKIDSTTGAVTNYTGTGIIAPNGLTVGPGGNLWFANEDSNSIGEITPAGSVTNFAGAGIETPFEVTLGPNGNLWFTNNFGKSIGEVTSAGLVTIFNDPSFNYNPKDIIVGPGPNLWFTFGESIGEITTTGLVTIFNDASFDAPAYITGGPNGNLWFTNQENASIGELDPTTGSVTVCTESSSTCTSSTATSSTSTATATSTSSSMTTSAPSFTTSAPSFTAVASTPGPGTSNTSPCEIITGPGPNPDLWFTNDSAASIGKIDPTTNTVTVFTGGGIVGPNGIILGPNGNLWFTNAGGSTIGEIDPTTGTVIVFTGTGIDEPADIIIGP
jgi:streptogramin lyase